MGAKKSKEQNHLSGERKKSVERELDFGLFPARVDYVKISGLDRTHDDYIRRASEKLFKVTNFKDVLLESMSAREHLNELGIFKNNRVLIDVSKGPNASKHGYQITFSGTELPRLSGEVGTEIGQNEGALTINLFTPNVWGRGERFTLNGSYSSLKTTQASLVFLKKFLHTKMGDYKPEVSFRIFRDYMNHRERAFKTTNYGYLADFSFLLPLQLSHSFQYECSIRNLKISGKSVPFFVRENCGPRMFSLLRYTCAYDQRDNPVFPTSGFYFRTLNEVSGFGGNVSYVLNTSHAEVNVPLFAGITAQLCGRIGLIQSHKKAADVPISSLLTLGGAQSLRGFKADGAGRHIEGVPAGAHSFWATGIHLWTPLPFNQYFGQFGNKFRTHLFYNFGNTDSFSAENLRSAAGLGLAFHFAGKARIEFNYCYPIDRQPGDGIQAGFQFGIGYEFI